MNIKKGQFVSPWDMKHAVEKCHAVGKQARVRHRARLQLRLQQPGRRHALARHHAEICARGLRRDPLRATALGLAAETTTATPPAAASRNSFLCSRARPWPPAWMAVFMEVHDNPKEAKSDGANALDSRKLRGVLKELLAIQLSLTAAHTKP